MEMSQFGGQIGVEDGYLKLKLSANQQAIGALHGLEKRLNVLLTEQEVEQIQENIRGDDHSEDSGAGTWNFAHSLNVYGITDRDFFNEIMSVIESGTTFIRHENGGVYEERYFLIHNDRLYWKEKRNDENEKFDGNVTVTG